MVASRAAADLLAERERLEAQIAELRRSLAVAEARLEVAKARGPDPRGFGWGLFVGAMLIAATVAGMFMVLATVLRMD